ncbi:MAG: hypothetical protein COB67_11750 [SAR324 cluster bacterium]|uniref:HPt domain-containing protein n=1 Tax=SAR324 cluster bacterium TaxID=2024889 RepID=A0A2A4SSH7_9DELT|nr:MAG: hypothetical protein COB67_11750 [SAR324 cluster bacterium]
MLIDDEEFYQELLGDFLLESGENLQNLTQDIATLLTQGSEINLELVGRSRRSVHSIKGGAGFIGLTKINQLALAMEQVLERIFQGKLAIEATTFTLLQTGVSHLKNMVDNIEESNNYDIEESHNLLQAL